LALNIIKRSAKIVLAAKHGLRLTKTAGRNIDRLTKMTNQVATDIRRTTLATMQQ
jgi:hypothetical protein